MRSGWAKIKPNNTVLYDFVPTYIQNMEWSSKKKYLKPTKRKKKASALKCSTNIITVTSE